jgi:sulfate permease, SulP family
VALSLVLLIARASSTRVAVLGRTPGGDFAKTRARPDLDEIPELLMLRLDGELFFGNANRVRHGATDLVAAADPRPRVVALVLTATFDLSLPTLDALAELEQDLARDGIPVVAGGVPTDARPQLDRDELAERLGTDRRPHTLAAAVARFTATT